MTISIGRIISLAALAAVASTELMQGAETATFHLPFTAHWGQVVLEPGDYKMYLPELSTGNREFVVKGVGKAVYEAPLVMGVQNFVESSYLKLREVNGNYFVREFSSGPSGETFTFPIPKTGRRQEMGKSAGIRLAVVSK